MSGEGVLDDYAFLIAGLLDLFDATSEPRWFDEAVALMIETGRGSVSLLQRRLGVGYSRASRLVDQMGQAGILGEHKGSVAREVLITLEEWEQMKAMEEAGAKVIYLSDAERKRWAEKLPNVAMNWAESMEQKGMPGKAVLKGYLDGLRQRGTVLVRDWDK